MSIKVHHYIDCLGDHLIRDSKIESLHDGIDISPIQAFAKTIKDLFCQICNTPRDQEQSKRDHTLGSNKELWGDFRPSLHQYLPWSVGSFPPQKLG